MAGRFITRQILIILVIILVFVLAASIAFALGLQRSLARWQAEYGISFDAFVTSSLGSVYLAEGRKDPQAIADTLSPYLDSSLYAVVFDASGLIMYWSWKGDVWYADSASATRMDAAEAEAWLAERIDNPELIPSTGPLTPDEGYGLAQSFLDQGILHEVSVAGEPIGYFVAGSNGFTVNRSNRRLLESLVDAAVFGLLVAVAVGLSVAVLWSRRLGRSIAELTGALSRIAAGNRNVRVPGSAIRELDSISHSATELQRELSRGEQLRRQWTMDVAHDLRTPVANLQAQLEGIADGLLPATPERISGLRAEARQLGRLSEDMLVLCKVESPELALDRQTISIAELAETVRASFEERFRAAGRTFFVEAEDATVSGDRELTVRAVGNLMENALRHGTGAVECLFSCEALEVRNNGEIPAQVLPHLFDRLYRGSPARSGDGHGLGLAIARAIAEAHGWSLTVRSADGIVRSRVVLSAGADRE